MKPAWITGSNGLIGNYIVRTAPKFGAQWWLRPLTRAQFDLLDFASIEREFKKDQPRLLIHCAAISSVADAQRNPALARKVNIEATQFLAELASEIQFVFFSSDLVFDGRKGHYREIDIPNPLHLYGETKVAAEQIVLKNPRHLVLRTSINGGISTSGNRGFNEQLWQALESGRGMTLFTDEFRCPIFAGETARAVWQLTEHACAGIVHVAGAEKLSRYEIGQLMVKRRPKLNAAIEPGLARDFPGPPRALDASLDISKAQKLLAKPLPGLTEWLATNPAEPF
ncbi:MAG TPA: NAD(P)-dependent oxidoreductase [Alphaproteobacteria bacterium]|nr:NAD(P)-dependent oxidoreductase [Alphaproteobacteria bacterium]